MPMMGRPIRDALRARFPTMYWRCRNFAALAGMYAWRAYGRGTQADAYDDAFWGFHSTGDWDGFARVVREFVNTRSIADIGCGHGLALAAFVRADRGVTAIGFDDSPAALRRARASGLDVEALDVMTLSGAGAAALAARLRGFDLALCLEVAEHLPSWHAAKLLAIVAAPAQLVFSAAHPNQGGRFHVNERSPDYWIARLSRAGMQIDPRDVEFRRAVAALDLPWWYARNVHLFRRGTQSPVNSVPATS